MNITFLHPGIIHVNFAKQTELTPTFIRMQEFYESPFLEINGKHFTLNQYKKIYKKFNDDTKFTYYTDWAGFNIPGEVILEFFKVFRKDLSPRERKLFSKIESYISNKKCDTQYNRFYLIGTFGVKKNSAFDHEIAHALYYLVADYKEECNRIYDLLPIKSRKVLNEYLLDRGYTQSVLVDEIQAYLSTDNIKKLEDSRFNFTRSNKPKMSILDMYKDNFNMFKSLVRSTRKIK